MIKKLVVFFIIYFLTYAGLAFKVYSDQTVMDKIMSNPVETVAKIDEVKESIKLKKGIKIKKYTIVYTFSETGKEYAGTYEMSADYYRNFKGKSELDVLFNKLNPKLNMPKSSIAARTSNGSFTDKLIKLLFFAFGVALIPYAVIAVLFGWMKLK